MQTLTIDNYGSLNVKERSELADVALKNQATITPKNTQGMAANQFVILGGPGVEASEIKQIQSIASGVVTLTSNLDRDHAKYETITVLFGNKIRVYRASNVDGSVPADVSFAQVGVDTDIDPDQQMTTFTDAGGGSDYWYKFVYANSVSLEYTSLAESSVVRGGNYGNYCSIQDVRQEAGLRTNTNITDAEIDKARQAAQSEINATLIGTYTVPFTTPINPLIAEITKQLAAGMLLLKSYGALSALNTNNGQQKVDEARKKLQRIKARELVLTDTTGSDTSLSNANSFGMWPDPTTADADASSGGADRLFRMSDREGYESRLY